MTGADGEEVVVEEEEDAASLILRFFLGATWEEESAREGDECVVGADGSEGDEVSAEPLLGVLCAETSGRYTA